MRKLILRYVLLMMAALVSGFIFLSIPYIFSGGNHEKVLPLEYIPTFARIIVFFGTFFGLIPLLVVDRFLWKCRWRHVVAGISSGFVLWYLTNWPRPDRFEDFGGWRGFSPGVNPEFWLNGIFWLSLPTGAGVIYSLLVWSLSRLGIQVYRPRSNPENIGGDAGRRD